MLYEILGLPPRKLATREAIRRAYRLQSLRYHPDKVAPEEAEEAAEKFLAVKTAYDLLLEGMESGGAGMGGAVFSGGDLEYRNPSAGGSAAGDTSAGLVQAAQDGGSGDGGSHGVNGGAGSDGRVGGVVEDEGLEMMDGAAQAERLSQMAAAAAAARMAAEEEADAAGEADANGVPWLSEAEVRALIDRDPKVAAALTAIAQQPSALGAYLADAVLMGVLHSVCATRGREVALHQPGSAATETDE